MTLKMEVTVMLNTNLSRKAFKSVVLRQSKLAFPDALYIATGIRRLRKGDELNQDYECIYVCSRALRTRVRPEHAWRPADWLYLGPPYQEWSDADKIGCSLGFRVGRTLSQ
jgi:hypothetical protein